MALLRGDVATALDHNVLYVLALPILGVLVLLWLVRRRWPAWVEKPVTVWSVAAVAVAFGVVRNLPIDALSVLGSSAGSN